MEYLFKRSIPVKHACVIKDYKLDFSKFECHCGGIMEDDKTLIGHNASTITHDVTCNKCQKRSAITVIINDYEIRN